MKGRWSVQDLASIGYAGDGKRVNRPPPSPDIPAPAPSPSSLWLPAPLLRGLKPEQRLQCAFVATFRPRLVADARLMPFQGEQAGGRSGQERRFQALQLIRRAMGYESGTPDLIVLRCGFHGFIELKRPASLPNLLGKVIPRGEPSQEQRAFRAWCDAHNHPYALVRDLDHGERVLRAWGMLTS